MKHALHIYNDVLRQVTKLPFDAYIGGQLSFSKRIDYSMFKFKQTDSIGVYDIAVMRHVKSSILDEIFLIKLK